MTSSTPCTIPKVCQRSSPFSIRSWIETCKGSRKTWAASSKLNHVCAGWSGSWPHSTQTVSPAQANCNCICVITISRLDAFQHLQRAAAGRPSPLGVNSLPWTAGRPDPASGRSVLVASLAPCRCPRSSRGWPRSPGGPDGLPAGARLLVDRAGTSVPTTLDRRRYRQQDQPRPDSTPNCSQADAKLVHLTGFWGWARS